MGIITYEEYAKQRKQSESGGGAERSRGRLGYVQYALQRKQSELEGGAERSDGILTYEQYALQRKQSELEGKTERPRGRLGYVQYALQRKRSEMEGGAEHLTGMPSYEQYAQQRRLAEMTPQKWQEFYQSSGMDAMRRDFGAFNSSAYNYLTTQHKPSGTPQTESYLQRNAQWKQTIQKEREFFERYKNYLTEEQYGSINKELDYYDGILTEFDKALTSGTVDMQQGGTENTAADSYIEWAREAASRGDMYTANQIINTLIELPLSSAERIKVNDFLTETTQWTMPESPKAENKTEGMTAAELIIAYYDRDPLQFIEMMQSDQGKNYIAAVAKEFGISADGYHSYEEYGEYVKLVSDAVFSETGGTKELQDYEAYKLRNSAEERRTKNSTYTFYAKNEEEIYRAKEQGGTSGETMERYEKSQAAYTTLAWLQEYLTTDQNGNAATKDVTQELLQTDPYVQYTVALLRSYGVDLSGLTPENYANRIDAAAERASKDAKRESDALWNAGYDMESIGKYLEMKQQSVMEQGRQAARKEYFEKYGQPDIPWYDRVAYGIADTVVGLVGDPFVGGMNLLSTAGKALSPSGDTNKPMQYEPMRYGEVIAAPSMPFREAASYGMGETGKFMYPIIITALQAFLGAKTFGKGYTYLMGASSGGNKAYEVMQSGGSPKQAIVTGILSGATEVLTERYSMEAILNTFNPKNFWGSVMSWLKVAPAEASEEMVSEAVSIVVDALFLGSLAENEKRVEEYVQKGMTPEEAKSKMLAENAMQILETGGQGALSGLFGATLSTAAGKAMTNAQINRISADFANEVMRMEGSQAYKLYADAAGIEEGDTVEIVKEKLKKFAKTIYTAWSKSDGQTEGNMLQYAIEQNADGHIGDVDMQFFNVETAVSDANAVIDAWVDSSERAGETGSAFGLLRDAANIRKMADAARINLDKALPLGWIGQDTYDNLTERLQKVSDGADILLEQYFAQQDTQQTQENRQWQSNKAAARGAKGKSLTALTEMPEAARQRNPTANAVQPAQASGDTVGIGAANGNYEGGTGTQNKTGKLNIDNAAETTYIKNMNGGAGNDGNRMDQGVAGGISIPQVYDRGNAGTGEIGRGHQGVPRRNLTQGLQSAFHERGVVPTELQDYSADSAAFSSALDAARDADERNGWCVTPQSEDELRGKQVFMDANHSIGYVVTADGDIEGVFKNKVTNRTRYALYGVMPQAIADGGTKLDCYGAGLVRVYEDYGFIPVARVAFNEMFANPGWDESKGRPYIYFMMHNGDSAETVIRNIGNYTHMSLEQLEALPLFRGENSYDDAGAYRDKLLAQRSALRDNTPTASERAAGSGKNSEQGAYAYGVERNEYSAQVDSKVVDAVDALAKLFRLKVRFADLGEDNGRYHSDTGLIELDIRPVRNRALNPFLFTVSHEIGHAIKARIGESAWSAFERYAVKVMGGETAVDAKRRSDAAYENPLDAREDVVCDFLGELLSDKQMLDAFCESIKAGEVETKTAHGVIGAIRQILGKLRKKGSAMKALLVKRVQRQFGTDLETAENAVKQMQRAVQLARNAEKNTAEDGNAKRLSKKNSAEESENALDRDAAIGYAESNKTERSGDDVRTGGTRTRTETAQRRVYPLREDSQGIETSKRGNRTADRRGNRKGSRKSGGEGEVSLHLPEAAVHGKTVESGSLSSEKAGGEQPQRRIDQAGEINGERQAFHYKTATPYEKQRIEELLYPLFDESAEWRKYLLENPTVDIVAEVMRRYEESSPILEGYKQTTPGLADAIREVEEFIRQRTEKIPPNPPEDASKRGDISDSDETDSDGNTLSVAQAEYFRDSVFRDENGNLLVMYHGSRYESFSVFEQLRGIWMSSNKDYALTYAEERNASEPLDSEVYADDVKLYQLYANATNPLDIGEINGMLTEKKLREIAGNMGIDPQILLERYGNRIGRSSIFEITRTEGFIDLAREYGFDSFIATESGIRTNCVFADRNQVALTTNKAPTEHPDIRYSKKDKAEIAAQEQETRNATQRTNAAQKEERDSATPEDETHTQEDNGAKSDRELLSDVSASAAVENSQERKHLREYREAFEKLKKTEQKRDTIATALKTVAPDSAGTASLRKSLRQLEETIARYESRLAKLESTKPLQALLTRLRQEELVAKAAKYDILSTKDAYNIGGKRDVEKVDFQFFANKGIKKQNNRELNKSILSWEANIKKHRAKIENPAKYDAEWHKKTKQQQAGLIRHWEKEIKTSEENVKEAKEELKRREFEE